MSSRSGLIATALILFAALTLPLAYRAGAAGTASGDGVAYLEIAGNALHSPLSLVSNGYWSPGYPALIALALKFTHPSPASELTVVYGLNWLICVLASCCFTYFFLNCLKWTALEGLVFDGIKLLGIVIFAYSLLLVGHVEHSLWQVGADSLLACFIYLAAGLCVRFSLPGCRPIHGISLGIVLAAGYSTKAAMFPLAVCLLVILVAWPAGRSNRKPVILAALSFFLASAPLVAALTLSTGRFTFGDTGKLNYAWFVNYTPPRFVAFAAP